MLNVNNVYPTQTMCKYVVLHVFFFQNEIKLLCSFTEYIFTERIKLTEYRNTSARGHSFLTITIIVS